MRASEELVDLIAAGPGAGRVADSHPSAAVRAHVTHLLRKEKADSLTRVETSEWDHYAHLEHIMPLAKVHPRQRLAHGHDPRR